MGYQGPAFLEGIMGTSGRVGLRSSHLQVISLLASEKWNLWSPDIKNALLRADGFARGAFRQAPSEWEPFCCDRVWKHKAPAFGLIDAPAAFRRPLKQHLLNSDAS